MHLRERLSASLRVFVVGRSDALADGPSRVLACFLEVLTDFLPGALAIGRVGIHGLAEGARGLLAGLGPRMPALLPRALRAAGARGERDDGDDPEKFFHANSLAPFLADGKTAAARSSAWRVDKVSGLG